MSSGATSKVALDLYDVHDTLYRSYDAFEVRNG
jgi:hypothetical protein